MKSIIKLFAITLTFTILLSLISSSNLLKRTSLKTTEKYDFIDFLGHTEISALRNLSKVAGNWYAGAKFLLKKLTIKKFLVHDLDKSDVNAVRNKKKNLYKTIIPGLTLGFRATYTAGGNLLGGKKEFTATSDVEMVFSKIDLEYKMKKKNVNFSKFDVKLKRVLVKTQELKKFGNTVVKAVVGLLRHFANWVLTLKSTKKWAGEQLSYLLGVMG